MRSSWPIRLPTRRLYRFRRTEEDSVAYRPGDGAADGSWWRPGLRNDFDGPNAVTALAAAARASASFPIAFVPVREGPELVQRRILPAASVDDKGTRWLVDGGVLDNAPFQPVLDAIGRRPATGPVRRLLVYVVPSRGQASTGLDRPNTSSGYEDAELPDWLTILGASLGFPREGDVRADMEYMAALLTGADAGQAGPEALLQAELESPTAIAEGLFNQYRRARAVGGLLDVRSTVALASEGRGVVLAPATPVNLEQLLELDLPWVPPAGAGLAPGRGGWAWGLGAGERVCRLLAGDLLQRVARKEDVGADGIRDVTSALTRVEAVRDAVAARLIHDAENAPPEDAACAMWARGHIEALRARAAVAHCVQQAAQGYAQARGDALGSAAVIRAALAVEVASHAFTAYAAFRRTAPFKLLRLGPDVDSSIVDRDDDDVRLARQTGDRKLYGTRIMHFAAFGLPEWRAWDWTAGRLDAQVHLTRALLPEDDDTRAWLTEWITNMQAATVHAELGRDADAWSRERQQLRTVDNAHLIGRLLSSSAGEQLVDAVVEAAMRALPHPRALHQRGQLINTLLARKPERRLPPLWAPVVRFRVRKRWTRWLNSLGRTEG